MFGTLCGVALVIAAISASIHALRDQHADIKAKEREDELRKLEAGFVQIAVPVQDSDDGEPFIRSVLVWRRTVNTQRQGE